MSGATAGIAVMAVRRRIISRFRTGQATAPERAATLSDLGVREGLIFRRMTSSGVLVEAGPQKWFLDEGAYERWRQRARVRVAMIILGIAVVGLVAWVLWR